MINNHLKFSFLLILISIFFTNCQKDEKIIPAPEIYFKTEIPNRIEIEVGDTVLITPKITYDIDSKYEWSREDIVIQEKRTYTFVSSKLGKEKLRFTVSTPYGKDTLNLEVISLIKIDFNDYELKNESYDRGDSIKTNDGFIFNNTTFPTNPLEDGYWTGFTISNYFDNRVTNEPSPFAAYNTKESNNNFLIYSQPFTPSAANIEFNNNKEHVISSISITNSQYSYLIMKYGVEELMRPFGGESNDINDWCKLIIRGFDKNGAETDTVNFYLADYRFKNRRKNYIINKWTQVNLEKLGKVNQIELSIESSIKDENGNILTPQIVCIDDIKIIE